MLSAKDGSLIATIAYYGSGITMYWATWRVFLKQSRLHSRKRPLTRIAPDDAPHRRRRSDLSPRAGRGDACAASDRQQARDRLQNGGVADLTSPPLRGEVSAERRVGGRCHMPAAH